MDFRNDGVSPKTVLIVRDALAAHISHLANVDVLSTEDLRRTLDVEAQRAAVGCTADQCMAEIASALGADYIVFGNVGVLGDRVVGNMSLLDAAHGVSLGREALDVADIGELPDAVRAAAARLVVPLAPAGGGISPWLVGGVAGVVVGAGAAIVGGVVSAGAYGVLRDEVSNAAAKDRAASDLDVYSAVAIAGIVAALLGAGAAAVPLVIE